MADDPHAVAIAARFATDPLLTVFDGKKPDDDPATAYVVWYLMAADAPSDNLSFDWGNDAGYLYTYSVARTAEGARIVANRVTTLFRDHVLVMPGREAWPMHREYSNPMPTRDESLGYAVFEQLAVWSFGSQPV